MGSQATRGAGINGAATRGSTARRRGARGFADGTSLVGRRLDFGFNGNGDGFRRGFCF